MLERVPNYIKRTGLRTNEIRYTWDDWDVDKSYEPLDKDVRAQMALVTHRANVAFTISCAEWIYWRFSTVSDDLAPIQYAEAAWAAIIDWRYTKYFEPPDADWMGPVRGPLSLAIIFVVNAIERMVHDDLPEIASASILALTKHVLPSDQAAFLSWDSWARQTAAALYPRNPANPRGIVVPREAMDPDADFCLDRTPDLIASFLSGLDPDSNPFLRTPAEMLACDFRGVPYTWSPQDDDLNEY